MTDLSFSFAYAYVLSACLVGFLFGIYNWFMVMSIDTTKKTGSQEEELLEHKASNGKSCIELMNFTAEQIQNGATTFLVAEYVFLGIFLVVFTIIILLVDSFQPYTAIAFVLGAVTSTFSGFIGMYVATRANVRVTYQASRTTNTGNAIREAFNAAFRGGCVMGFCLVSLALAVLTAIIFVYLMILKPKTSEDFTRFFEFIAGYGLGGSTVALFCRVGGGIYTKAADVGADLVGKVFYDLSEDSPENPATIADNVGDNVGDIAGMGADLFGSLAESTSAALVVSGTSAHLINQANFFYPLILSASGIFVCIITALFATHVNSVDKKEKIQSTLQLQLIISTVLLLPSIYFITMYALPAEFSFVLGSGKAQEVIKTSNFGIMVCANTGLVAGLLIGYVTDYYTSHEHEPTRELSKACKSGAAINIIQGLALGYMSCIIPILALAVTIFVSFKLAGMYGIAIAALGMLSNLGVSLAIDAYGPISDNAGGISEMSELPHEVREITDALDAAGNTTAAVGKGFAIGSACLVSLALFGAFITRSKLTVVNILEPIQISCLIVGAMIPYAFSALTMKSVGLAAAEMCDQIKIQIQKGDKNPTECIRISTEASLKEMIAPGVIVSKTIIIYFRLFSLH